MGNRCFCLPHKPTYLDNDFIEDSDIDNQNFCKNTNNKTTIISDKKLPTSTFQNSENQTIIGDIIVVNETPDEERLLLVEQKKSRYNKEDFEILKVISIKSPKEIFKSCWGKEDLGK